MPVSSASLKLAEQQRLAEDARRDKNWKRWGTYLTERQWGTVREDYSSDGDSWNYFTYEDAVSRTYMLDLMRSLERERGIAQIFISHDLGSIAGIADRVAVLYQGRIVESRPTHELIDQPAHPYTRRLLDSVLRLESDRPADGRLAVPTSWNPCI